MNKMMSTLATHLNLQPHYIGNDQQLLYLAFDIEVFSFRWLVNHWKYSHHCRVILGRITDTTLWIQHACFHLNFLIVPPLENQDCIDYSDPNLLVQILLHSL